MIEHVRLMEEHVAKYKGKDISDEEKRIVPQLDSGMQEYKRASGQILDHLLNGDDKSAMQVMVGRAKTCNRGDPRQLEGHKHQVGRGE